MIIFKILFTSYLKIFHGKNFEIISSGCKKNVILRTELLTVPSRSFGSLPFMFCTNLGTTISSLNVSLMNIFLLFLLKKKHLNSFVPFLILSKRLWLLSCILLAFASVKSVIFDTKISIVTL